MAKALLKRFDCMIITHMSEAALCHCSQVKDEPFMHNASALTIRVRMISNEPRNLDYNIIN